MYKSKSVKKMPWQAKAIFVLMSMAVLTMAIVICVFGAKINRLDKTDELTKRDWEKGLIGADGGEIRGTIAIRTKGFVPIDGLTFDLRENPGITYQIFWYDENKVFIEATDELVVDYDMTTKPELGEYARIMIKPMNDPEVSRSEIADYASELAVEWNK